MAVVQVSSGLSFTVKVEAIDTDSHCTITFTGDPTSIIPHLAEIVTNAFIEWGEQL